MQHLLEQVAFASAEDRLAPLLLALQDATGVVLSTHEQLAAQAGLARETVSRRLSAWAREGLVRLRRGRIEVLKPEALRQHAAPD
jgi:CRP/FNR family transcriptional regulator, anaerobic regulatory protein